MAFKFVVFAALVAAASAGLVAPQHGLASSHQSFQLHTPVHQHLAAPVHHVAAVHAAPVHHVAAVHHAAPVHHVAAVHHAAPVHHVAAVHHAAPIHHVAAVHAAPVHVEHHAPANYEFSYSVHDAHTGDIKSQHETRHGDEVHGQYSLVDSDGHQRIVDYHADHHTGFNAVVRREPIAVKVAQPVHKVIAAQPVHHVATHHAHIAPVAHHVAPIAHHVAPIAHHVAPIAHHVAPVAHAAITHLAPVARYGPATHGNHATGHINHLNRHIGHY